MKRLMTIDDVTNEVASIHYINPRDAMPAFDEEGNTLVYPAEMGLITLCILVLKNGYTIVGSTQVIHPELYDREKGRSAALNDALRQVGPVLAFRIKDQMLAGEINE